MNAWVWRSAAAAIGCGAVVLVGVGAAAQGRVDLLEKAPPRTTLSGIAVGGLSPTEVRNVADDLAARLLATPLTLKFGGLLERTTPARLGASCNAEAATQAVLTPQRPDTPLEGLAERFSGPAPREVPLPVRFDPVVVRKALARFASRIGGQPREPRLTKVDGKFRLTEATPGRDLDPEALAASLEKALGGRQFRASLAESIAAGESRAEWLADRAPVEVPALTRPGQSRVTADHLAAITTRLASFSTGLGGSSRNRVGNIRIACKAIDGKILLPGDVFSYNEVVGPRVPSAGYKNAPVIINGELEQGLAGGICQVSSTLYNLALVSDMTIVSRRHHAFPVHYLPAGRDATVVDGAIDFRFRNGLEHPVAIDAKVIGNHVQFHLYGHPEDKREVEIVSSGVKYTAAGVKTVSDPKLPKGKRVTDKRSKTGKRVTITRVVKKDGAVVRRETVSRDYYAAQTGIVRVGTREAPRAPVAPSTPVTSPPGATTPPAISPAPAPLR